MNKAGYLPKSRISYTQLCQGQNHDFRNGGVYKDFLHNITFFFSLFFEFTKFLKNKKSSSRDLPFKNVLIYLFNVKNPGITEYAINNTDRFVCQTWI